MTSIHSQHAREFAIDIVKKLRDAGFRTLWAGGCVRDELLGLRPKDYDVATNATPQQIRDVFGRRQTLAIGQAFGVITVLGPKSAGQVEVATFRRDAEYSDGRHPDGVTFCDAEEDAKRRDFTINGLFYDPLQQEVIDYVGGREDLQRRVVRAIGDPDARLSEDKLRMMRGVRIAANFDFELDAATLAAIQRRATEISVVSAERITAELRKMLNNVHCARAVELLRVARLLPAILPELECPRDSNDTTAEWAAWQVTLDILRHLPIPHFPAAMAALLRRRTQASPDGQVLLEKVAERLTLTNIEHKAVSFLLANESTILAARTSSWPDVQRVLIEDGVLELVGYCRAITTAAGGDIADIEFCEAKLRLPIEVLNPPHLASGVDLKAAGIPPGPAYKDILKTIRDAQLEGRISSKQEAREMIGELAPP